MIRRQRHRVAAIAIIDEPVACGPIDQKVIRHARKCDGARLRSILIRAVSIQHGSKPECHILNGCDCGRARKVNKGLPGFRVYHRVVEDELGDIRNRDHLYQFGDRVRLGITVQIFCGGLDSHAQIATIVLTRAQLQPGQICRIYAVDNGRSLLGPIQRIATRIIECATIGGVHLHDNLTGQPLTTVDFRDGETQISKRVFIKTATRNGNFRTIGNGDNIEGESRSA